MIIKNHYPILAIVTTVLCTLVLGQLEPSLPQSDLIGHPNPAFMAVEAVVVSVSLNTFPFGEESCEVLKTRTALEINVAKKLNEAGIRALPKELSSILFVPELKVEIDVLELGDSQQCVFHAQTSFVKAVYPAKNSSQFIMAELWQTAPVMRMVSLQDMLAEVNDVISEQVEAFISAWHIANQQGVSSADVSDTSVAENKSPTPSVELTSVKSTPAEYQYVASKNSKVFHKSECSSAKRIKPENLVGYGSRDDAIKAGKRPCKICKP